MKEIFNKNVHSIKEKNTTISGSNEISTKLFSYTYISGCSKAKTKNIMKRKLNIQLIKLFN